DGEYRSVVIFRKCHRSSHYFSDGPDHLTMSPGCADMAGVFIVPVEDEYERITPELLGAMVEEVTIGKETEDTLVRRLTRTQPMISVGIMSAPEIEFEILSDGAGLRKAVCSEGKIMYDGAVYDELYFEANTLSTMFAEPSFALSGVTIGKQFHWERKENQKFAGALKIIVEKGLLTAVNVIGVEDYLVSVISSEMKATASLEFLKAHSVISRSWVMARLEEKRGAAALPELERFNDVPSLVSYLDSVRNGSAQKSRGEHIVWYGRSEHKNYTVCADDHCQRYQGLTKAIGDNVRKAVDATWGEVLTYDGKLCDARFSKCCGGMMERFSACWEDVDYPYLRAIPDTPGHDPAARPFCDTSDAAVLFSQVLNGYDLETTDFFSWRQEYGVDELSELVSRKSGRSIGRLTGLIPLEKGKSGRIIRLEIQGTEDSFVMGKELEIRRLLSETHLKSSAFDAEFTDDGRVVLTGRGWGHGVGLCQIGAAVMASQGYSYENILEHYYPGSDISGKYPLDSAPSAPHNTVIPTESTNNTVISTES
ncbi:MAG: SpoIID/LytB domain-containing protein, partial [Candidatus Cryptobacteroides sp.]